MAGKSPSLRRIKADIRELSIDPSDRYVAAPLEDDMFEWHFTIRGADETEFAGGIYHGRILLPPEYPFKPPNIVFLTPSGRFEVGTKVCLSFSAHHPELWQPAWGIRLILEALISFLPTPADGALGSLDWTKAERKRLAKESVKFCCAKCGPCLALLPKLKEGSSGGAKKPSRFQKEIEQLHALQVSHHEKKDTDGGEEKEKAKADGGDASASESAKSAGEGEASAASGADEDKEPEQAKGSEKDIVADALESAPKEDESQKPPATPGSPSAEAPSTTPSAHEPSPAAADNTTASTDEAGQESVSARVFREVGGVNTENAPNSPAPAAAPAQAPAPARQAERTVIPSEEPPLTPWFSDPVVHAIIILFAVLVAILYRKFTTLLDELQSLTNEYASS